MSREIRAEIPEYDLIYLSVSFAFGSNIIVVRRKKANNDKAP